MPRTDKRDAQPALEDLLGEASWLLSHAEALADYERNDEAKAELVRAANCEEEVACLLDASGREDEAVVHRVSAASCHERLGQYARAVTLLRAALSGRVAEDYERRIQRQLTGCLSRTRRKQPVAHTQSPERAAALA